MNLTEGLQPAAAATGRGRAVLCVDDEPAILAALRRSLAGGEYEVLTSASPVEALSLMVRRPVDLVICDHVMPELSGIEMLGEVRRRSPDTDVVLLTGFPENLPGRAGLAAGIRIVVTKPWDDFDLRCLVARLLGRRDPDPCADSPVDPSEDRDLGGGD